MRKRKTRKRIVLIIVILIVLCAGLFVFKKVYNKFNTFNVKVVEKVDNYPYTLDDRDTELYKSVFNDLKSVLNNKEIDFEKYAEDIAKLYIIDVYTLSNKVNKYDIPALEFIYPAAVDNYKLKIQDTLYKYILDNTNKKREQKLPEVSSVEVNDIKEIKFDIDKETFEGYEVLLSWEYISDMGYDKKGVISIVKKDDMLYIVQYKNK